MPTMYDRRLEVHDLQPSHDFSAQPRPVRAKVTHHESLSAKRRAPPAFATVPSSILSLEVPCTYLFYYDPLIYPCLPCHPSSQPHCRWCPFNLWSLPSSLQLVSSVSNFIEWALATDRDSQRKAPPETNEGDWHFCIDLC